MFYLIVGKCHDSILNVISISANWQQSSVMGIAQTLFNARLGELSTYELSQMSQKFSEFVVTCEIKGSVCTSE